MIFNILLLSLAALFQQSPTEAAPAMRQDKWWQERHQLINQRAQETGEECQLILLEMVSELRRITRIHARGLQLFAGG